MEGLELSVPLTRNTSFDSILEESYVGILCDMGQKKGKKDAASLETEDGKTFMQIFYAA
jgi:hypothetical protein